MDVFPRKLPFRVDVGREEGQEGGGRGGGEFRGLVQGQRGVVINRGRLQILFAPRLLLGC